MPGPEQFATPFVGRFGEALAKSRLEGAVVDLPLHEIGAQDVAEDVQDAAVEAWDGGIEGWFVTATSPTTQRILRLDTPIFGPLVSSTQVEERAHLRLPFGVLGAECCFGLIIGAPYPDPRGSITRSSLEKVVLGCLPMIAILGRRVRGTVPLNAYTATADFALHVASVKGKPVFDMRVQQLAAIDVAASIDGAVLTRANSRDLVADPMELALWLARGLQRRGRQVSPGSILAIGSGGLILQVLSGQRFKAEFDTLGSVEVWLD